MALSHGAQFSWVAFCVGALQGIVSIIDLGSKVRTFLILCMKIKAFLTMTFCTVSTFISLTVNFVWDGIIPSWYLKLANPSKTAGMSDFCRILPYPRARVALCWVKLGEVHQAWLLFSNQLWNSFNLKTINICKEFKFVNLRYCPTICFLVVWNIVWLNYLRFTLL